MKAMEIELWGKTYRLALVESRYSSNDSLYLGLVDEETKEPFADLTVNLPTVYANGDCQFVDTNGFPEVVDLIEKYDLGIRIGTGYSGFCEYPFYSFDREAFEQYLTAEVM